MIGDDKFDKIVKGTAGVTTGLLEAQWAPNLLRSVRSSANTDGMVDDSGRAVRMSVVVMTLFDRIPPGKNDKSMSYSRPELLRRGGRELDMSQLVAAGNLVILAEVDNAPLPFPMDVEGDRMKGEGQATLPLRNRTRLAQPAAEEPPATAPTAEPPAAVPAAAEPATAEPAGQRPGA
jgi:hypothetical protein